MIFNIKKALESCFPMPEKIIVFNIPDPFGGTLQDYRDCAESIKTELVKVYDRIR